MNAIDQMLGLAHVQVVLDTRCLLGGEFDIAHEALQAGEAAFHQVLAGSCRVKLEGGPSLQLSAGDFLLLPHGSAHTIRHAKSSGKNLATTRVRTHAGAALPIKSNLPARRMVVEGSADLDLLCGRYVYAGGAGRLLSQWLPAVLVAHLHEGAAPAALDAICSLLRSESVSTPQPASLTVISGLGQALLGLALRAAMGGTQIAPEASMLRLAQDHRLAPSLEAVLAEPHLPWNIERLAQLCAMSRATYARHVQSVAGCGVAEFVLQVRMMHACELLEQGDRSIADIAQAVGYAAEASFATAFRRVMGETPGRWRRDAS